MIILIPNLIAVLADNIICSILSKGAEGAGMRMKY